MINVSVWMIASLLFLVVLVEINAAPSALNNDRTRAGSENRQNVAINGSELKLRTMIAAANNELEDLEDEFMQQMRNVYVSLKSDDHVGIRAAFERSSSTNEDREGGADEDDEQSKRRMPMIAQSMNEQFVELLITRYIVQWRLLKGLIFVSTRLMPMATILRSIERYPDAYGWLEKESKLDLSSSFPNLSDDQHCNLYALIELRARNRAADDFVTFSSHHIHRILESVQRYLIDNQTSDLLEDRSNLRERASLAKHAQRMLDYYTDKAGDSVSKLNKLYDQLVDRWADSLVPRQLGEGSSASVTNNKTESGDAVQRLTQSIDQIIDEEMIDIDLSQEADWMTPPITDAMVQADVPEWLPARVVRSTLKDRKTLTEHGQPFKSLIDSDGAEEGSSSNRQGAGYNDNTEDGSEDRGKILATRTGNGLGLVAWAADASYYICKRY